MQINWQDVVTTVGVTTLSGGVLLGAAAWLIRTVLTDRLARDAETFKTRLKTAADMEIEKLKNSLQLITVEHQVRFSKLHEKRAEVIATLYTRLVDVYRHGQMFVLTNQNNPQLKPYLETQTEVVELFSFIQLNRIYLSEDLCTRLEKFAGDVQQHVSATGIYGSIEDPNAQTIKEKGEALSRALKAFEKDLPATRRAVETEFRNILGVEQDAHGGTKAGHA